jgi:hypothetical protein
LNHPDKEVGRRLDTTTHGKVEGALQLDAGGDIELQRAEGSYKTLHYQPNQLHVHAPSEHTINGEYYDLEMHFVMLPHSKTGSAAKEFADGQTAKDGDADFKANYAVLGVMFRETTRLERPSTIVKPSSRPLKPSSNP